MSSFTDFTLNKTVDEIDAKVLQTGGKVTAIAQGYTLRCEVPRVGDWTFIWTDTRGEGNRGVLVATPTNKRTADIVRQGRINAIEECVKDVEFAELYVTLSKGVQYSLEERVIEVVYNYHLQLAGLTPGSWREASASLGEEVINKIKENGLSFWRLETAIYMSGLIVKSYV